MSFEWRTRALLLELTHRWPLALLAILIGCLGGWLVSLILPASYQAETTLYVTYNADLILRNPDDYKNWHMSQLEALAFAPDVLKETLERLRLLGDSYWFNVSKADLKDFLDLYWRNTGTWRMVARTPQRERSTLLLKYWTQVFLEKYEKATKRANDLLELDKQYNFTTIIQIQAKERQIELEQVRNFLQNWQSTSAQTPDSPTEVSQSSDELTRWQLFSNIAQVAGFDPAWQALLNSFPGTSAPLQEYQEWVDQAISTIDSELNIVRAKSETLEAERQELKTQYDSAFNDTRGLSATVYVEPTDDIPSAIITVRSTSITAIIGGILGLLIWILLILALVSMRMRYQVRLNKRE